MTDVTFENALKAMDIALEKGDTDAAREMARLAKSLEGQAVPTDANTGFMPQLNKGISETAGGLIDFLNPFDQPHALNPFPEGTGSAEDGVEALFERAGVEFADAEPSNTTEAIARGIGQGAASLIPVAATAQRLRTVGGTVGQFADDAYRALTTKVGAMSEPLAAGIGAGAEQLTMEAGAPDWMQNTAAIAAPMSIPAAAAATRGIAKASPVGIVARKVASDLAPFTKSGARAVAGKRIQDLAGGPERAEELASRVVTENPLNLTPAQQTGDPNMLAVEKLASDQDPNIRNRLTARKDEAHQLAQNEVSSVGGSTADIEHSQSFFEHRRRAFAANLQARADAAQKGADERLQGITSTRTDGDNSLAATKGIESARRAARADEKRLWSAVAKDVTVPTTRSRAKAQEWVEELGRAGAGNMPDLARKLLVDEAGYGEMETAKEMHRLYSKLREVARNARSGNNRQETLGLVADDIADAILADLGAVDGSTSVGKQINEARAFSAALHETFGRGAPGRLAKRTLDGDTAIDPELALKRTVGRGGTEAAVAARQIETAGAPTEFVQDYIAGQFSRRASSATGEIKTANARGFMADNKELLQRYPELRQEISDAVAQKETAEQFAARIANRIRALDDAKRSAVVGFKDAQTEKAANAILNAKNPVQAARRVAAEARKDKSGRALAGVKGAFTDHLIAGARSANGLNADRLVMALDDPKTARAMRQVFSASEMSRMRFISRELKKAQAKSSANIGQELSGARANRVIEFAARIMAANRGAQLGEGAAGLQTAQMASSNIKRALAYLASDKASQMMADAVTDPELFKALLTQVGAPKAQKQSIQYFLPYLIGGAVSAGG